MPTGYTAELVENGQSFEEFVWRCARGMGACIMMRDDPLDKLPPEKFDPSDYNLRCLEEAKAKYERLKSMDSEEQFGFGKQKKFEAVKSSQNYVVGNTVKDTRLEEMEKLVLAWEVPTPDHQGLKDFMLQQLNTSKTGMSDWASKTLAEAQEKSEIEYYQDALKSAKCDIEYHTKKHDEEVERTNKRNQWLADLRESVPVPGTEISSSS